MAANVQQEHFDEGTLQETFESASNFVRKKAAKLPSEDLLYFYARFKQAYEGKCDIPKPYFFDFQGKQKWEAWKKLGDMPKDQAMKEYLDFLSKCFPAWEIELDDDGGGGGDPGGLGIGVSRMVADDEEVADDDKTIFDWCKEGNVNQVQKCLDINNIDVNRLDEEGMGLLHWACDRGLDEMVALLLKYKADKNIKDSDGQTPLHYAVDCQHANVMKILLDNKVETSIEDHDGVKPGDITTSTTIKTLLNSHNSQ